MEYWAVGNGNTGQLVVGKWILGSEQWEHWAGVSVQWEHWAGGSRQWEHWTLGNGNTGQVGVGNGNTGQWAMDTLDRSQWAIGTLGWRQEYTQDGTSTYQRSPHTHTLIHTLRTTHFWGEMGGNWRIWRRTYFTQMKT